MKGLSTGYYWVQLLNKKWEISYYQSDIDRFWIPGNTHPFHRPNFNKIGERIPENEILAANKKSIH